MNSETYAAMSEWLSSLIRNQMGSARTGSNRVRRGAVFSLTRYEPIFAELLLVPSLRNIQDE